MYNKLEDSRLDSTLSIVHHHFHTTYFIRSEGKKQDCYPCWQYGCLQIWQIPRWQKQDGCFHSKKPCGMAASKPIAVTLLEKCAVLSRSEFFNVILSAQTDKCHTCTLQMQMLQCPDTLYTLLSILISAKECVTGVYNNSFEIN